MRDPIHLLRASERIDKPWAPRVVASLNDYRLKLARLEGEFVWHSHDDTDEAFYVLAGEFEMQLRDGVVPVRAGELVVVPKGLEHRPVAREPCTVLLVEPAGLLNVGSAHETELAAPVDEWL